MGSWYVNYYQFLTSDRLFSPHFALTVIKMPDFSQNSSKRCYFSWSSKGIIMTSSKPICYFQFILVLEFNMSLI